MEGYNDNLEGSLCGLAGLMPAWADSEILSSSKIREAYLEHQRVQHGIVPCGGVNKKAFVGVKKHIVHKVTVDFGHFPPPLHW